MHPFSDILLYKPFAKNDDELFIRQWDSNYLFCILIICFVFYLLSNYLFCFFVVLETNFSFDAHQLVTYRGQWMKLVPSQKELFSIFYHVDPVQIVCPTTKFVYRSTKTVCCRKKVPSLPHHPSWLTLPSSVPSSIVPRYKDIIGMNEDKRNASQNNKRR